MTAAPTVRPSRPLGNMPETHLVFDVTKPPVDPA
jgi:hypothetical protein